MRRVIALSLVAILTISMLSACGKGNDNTNDSTNADMQSGSNAMGRYLESELNLPEEGQRVIDIQILEDGSIAVALASEDTMTLWSSKDTGATWEKQYDVPLDVAKKEYIANATLASDKTMLAIVYSEDLSETSMGGLIWGIDSNGNKKELNITLPEMDFEGMGNGTHTVVMRTGGEDGEDAAGGEMVFEQEMNTTEGEMATGQEIVVTGGEASVDGEVVFEEFSFDENNMQDAIWEIKTSANKEVLAQTVMGKLLNVDIETGEVVQEYKIGEEYITNYSIVNGDVYIETNRGLKRYDLESGDSKEIAESLSAKVTSDADSTDMMYMQQAGLTLTSKSGETDVIYLIDSSGIYRQSEDGTVLEQIVDASLTSLSMPNTAIKTMLVLEDDSFLVNAEGATGENTVYHYSYDANAKTTPEKEISIYALADNREIRQAIAMYQKENPDIMVSMQIGMTGEEGITVSDALNTLNTEIMAGKGPDLLVLDGMPIDSYVEKGVLEDIGEIVEQIDNQDGILAGIKNSHAIASRFSVPYVQGAAKHVDQIKDIDTLGKVSNEIKKDNPNANTLSGRIIEELMHYLYRVNVNSFITDEGKLEKEKMQNFLSKAKEIADDNRANEEAMENQEDSSIVMSSAAMAEGYDVMSVTIDLLLNPKVVGRGEIKSIANLATILEVNKKENMKYSLLTDEANDKLLLTNTILGINSKSENLEEAKEFLAFCLSKEVQMSDQGLGLPVNKVALNETLYKEMEEIAFGMSMDNDDGVETTVTLSVKQPEKPDVENFEKEILGSAKIGYSNSIVQEIIMEQLMGYVEGRMTLEEATEAVNQNVSLYLAE